MAALRPLRRLSRRREAGRLAHEALRAGGRGRPHLGARHRRQQGPAPRDAERDRAVARDARRAADAHQGDPRGRRGDGQRAAAEIRRGESRAVEGRPVLLFRRPDVPQRPAGAADGRARQPRARVLAKGAKRNLHSGNFGGVSPNPTLDLIHLLAEMVDRDGKLLVPGAAYAEVTVAPADLEAVRTLQGRPRRFPRERGRRAHHRHRRRALPRAPDAAARVQRLGIHRGLHRARASRTIIYKEALAKADVRLVGGQDPDAVFDAIRSSRAIAATTASRSRASRARPLRARRSTIPWSRW